MTQMLVERLPRGRVVAVDASPSMVKLARAALPADRVTVAQADLAELDLELRDEFVRAVAWRCEQPLELDYVRLNVVARRPGTKRSRDPADPSRYSWQSCEIRTDTRWPHL